MKLVEKMLRVNRNSAKDLKYITVASCAYIYIYFLFFKQVHKVTI